MGECGHASLGLYGTIQGVTNRADALDWSRLFFSDGPATDVPRHLRALLSDDAWAHVAGYATLWRTAGRGDGKAWPVTAPAALLICDELLDNPLLGPDDPTLRDAMLAYLHTVAVFADRRSQMWDDGTGLGELVLDQATLACYDIVPEILNRVLPYLAAERGRRRAAAAAAVGALARHPSVSEERPALVERLALLAVGADDFHDLATIVMAIGRLGGDTRRWLGHENLGVRGCAALSPMLAADETATRVLRSLAQSPGAFEASFGDMAPPMQFQVAPHSSAHRWQLPGVADDF